MSKFYIGSLVILALCTVTATSEAFKMESVDNTLILKASRSNPIVKKAKPAARESSLKASVKNNEVPKTVIRKVPVSSSINTGKSKAAARQLELSDGHVRGQPLDFQRPEDRPKERPKRSAKWFEGRGERLIRLGKSLVEAGFEEVGMLLLKKGRQIQQQ